MATSILLTDLTNDTSTGVFDSLMNAVNNHINVQYGEGRITGADYANVYLSSMQTVLAESMQFLLNKKLQEAQIDGVLTDTLLKTEELALKKEELNRVRNLTEAELEQQWGYSVTRDVNGALVLGANTGTGKVNKDIAAVDQQIANMQDDLLTKAKQRALMYAERVLADKKAAALGLDDVIKTTNTIPEAVYTPKYNEV